MTAQGKVVELPGGGEAIVRALGSEELQAIAVNHSLTARSADAGERAQADEHLLSDMIIVAGALQPTFHLGDRARLRRVCDDDYQALLRGILDASNLEGIEWLSA